MLQDHPRRPPVIQRDAPRDAPVMLPSCWGSPARDAPICIGALRGTLGRHAGTAVAWWLNRRKARLFRSCRPAVPHSIRSAYSGCRDQRLPFNERLWPITMSVYGTEQPVCLAVDPVGEVQDIGAAVVDAVDPEGEGPEAASPLSARVDRDRAVKIPVARDKGIDLAMEEAEVADQHIIAEPAETGRCDGNPPGGGEAAAGDQFPNEVAVFIEDSHDPLP